MWFRVEFSFNLVDVHTDTLWLSLTFGHSPFPFCQAVYQDRLRKEVKKMRAVATVPFLSLISFQRLSAAPVAPRLHSALVQRFPRASASQISAWTEPSHHLYPDCVKSEATLLQ